VLSMLSTLGSTADVRITLLGVRKLPFLTYASPSAYADACAQHAAQMLCMWPEPLTQPQRTQTTEIARPWGIASVKKLSLFLTR